MEIKILNYFLNPYEEGYTIEKTLVFALLFVVLAFVIYKVLKKLKIKVDRRSIIATLPFIFLGSSLKVIVDNGIIKKPNIKNTADNFKHLYNNFKC
jgi:uncharacterized membrane protein